MAETRPPITLVIDGSLDQPTGGYIYDRLVVDGLRDRGAEVRVMSLEAGSFAASVRAASRFRRELAIELSRGAIVIVDELCHPRVALAAASRRRDRGRLLTLVHHLAASERSGLAAGARLLVERALLRSSDGVIVTSQTTRGAVLATGVPSSRVRVVRPGRDRLGVRSAPRARAERAPLRLLFVGALTPRKAPLTLLAAFAAVAERATLTLLGPADRDPLHAAAVLAAAGHFAGRARVLGAVPNAELARAFAEHDVLVMPSRYEGFGIVLGEAMSHGLAVVATRAGAIPEVTGGAAALVAPDDARALGAELLRLVDEPARLDTLRRAAIARAADLPLWADTQREFDAALGSFAGRIPA